MSITGPGALYVAAITPKDGKQPAGAELFMTLARRREKLSQRKPPSVQALGLPGPP